MKVTGKDQVPSVERTAPAQPVAAPATKADRVTVEAKASAEAVSAAAARAAGGRVERLREIEDALKTGTYRPDPSVVADQILAAAELDARLAAMFRR